MTEHSSSDEEVLALLRTPGLSIKNLDGPTRERVREYLVRKHAEQGVSLSDIAKQIGNKTSGYTSWLARQLGVQPRDFEEARLKGIHEKVRKYERRPFDGSDEDKAYLLGLRHGDLSVSRPFGDAIRVSVSTTHPAMAKLFTNLFQRYGHVYQHPRFKKDTQSYEWNLSSILDSSFDFLLQEFPETAAWVVKDEKILLAYLSGFLDAEGSFVTTVDQFGKVHLFLDFNNSEKQILEWIQFNVKKMGFYGALRLNKKAGVRTKKYGIVHRSDYWQLSFYGMNNIQDLIGKFHPRHPEKIGRQRIAMSVRKGQLYSTVGPTIDSLRAEIKMGISDFLKEAETEYLKEHSKPTV